jgi:hypothetical protein
MQWECFGGFSLFARQRGTLQLIAIHVITLHNILEYMQIAIIQTEAADFAKMFICVILKTFGQDCTSKILRLRSITKGGSKMYNFLLSTSYKPIPLETVWKRDLVLVGTCVV